LNPGQQAEIDDEVWRNLIGEVDTDGDGKVKKKKLLIIYFEK